MKLFQQAISDLNELQYVLSLWQKANFEEDECTAEWMIVGATEELGEASHVLLKSRQKIREYPFGFDEKAKADLEDAVGDICVYLMQLCTKTGISFGDALFNVSRKVLERNWVENRKDGES